MSRWVWFFAVLNVLSALAVVFYTQSTREQFFALQEARVESDELQLRWESLALEQSTWGDHGRIAQRARGRLAMRPPAATEVLVLQP